LPSFSSSLRSVSLICRSVSFYRSATSCKAAQTVSKLGCSTCACAFPILLTPVYNILSFEGY
jgi:hypothetical protein